MADVGRQLARAVSGAHKAAEEEDERIDRAIADVDWSTVATATADALEDVARDGARQVLAILAIDDADITEQVFASAVDWARARAAELVGRRWGDDGELVDSPRADMAITDTLRDSIRGAVSDAIEAGDSAAELADAIQGLGEFSDARAEMIARTEVIRAHGQGQLSAMRGSGVVEKKGWSTAEDEGVCPICDGNEAAGDLDLENDFPSGDDAPPAHPWCRCAVTASIRGPDDEGDEDEGGDAEDDEG